MLRVWKVMSELCTFSLTLFSLWCISSAYVSGSSAVPTDLRIVVFYSYSHYCTAIIILT